MSTEYSKGIILVGGPSKGTRFRPLSFDVPKPLFPVAGIEMIRHHVHALSKIQNLKEIILLGFFDSKAFGNFIKTIEDTYKIPCKYYQESQEAGTAGGLYQYREKIFESGVSNYIVMNCDICSSFPLDELLTFHKAHGKMCTIMSVQVGKDETQNYGCLIKNDATNELVHYVEKPDFFVSDHINTGVYIFNSKVSEVLIEAKKAKEEEKKGEQVQKLKKIFKTNNPELDSLSIEKNVLMPLAGKEQVYIFDMKKQTKTNFWRQIKNAAFVLNATVLYLEYYKEVDDSIFKDYKGIKGDILIHSSAEVDPTAKIGPNAVIGSGAKIGKGARIVNSIILDGAEIMDHSLITNSIIGWNSIIGQWVRIEGSGSSKNEGAICVTILGVGVTVESEKYLNNCIVLPYKKLNENYSNEIIL